VSKTLFKGAAVISMDPKIGVLAKGDVLIKKDKIVAVGKRLKAGKAKVVDASDRIIMPGFVDAHLHTWQTGIRGIAGNWSIMDYVRNMHANLATRYSAKDTYLGNLIGALNQINCGVTSVLDWCHNNHTPAHSDAAIDGLKEAGIRALFCHGTPKPDPKDGAPPYGEIPHPRKEIKRLMKDRLPSRNGLVSLGMAILGPDLSTYKVTKHDLKLAREFDLTVSSHIWGGPNAKNPKGIERMAKDGLLSEKLNVVHGNYLTDTQLQLLKDAGSTFTVTPEIELYMSHAEPLTGRLRNIGVDPSLGVDVESGISGDMFTVLRMALQSQRMFDNLQGVKQGKKLDAVSIPPLEALRWATINGARVLGMEDRIGSLTPGKQADLIVLRADDLNMFPVHNPVEAVVFHANPGNVDTVMIAGKLVKKGGRLTYKKLRKKMSKLKASGDRLLSNSGVELSVH
jgi:cytosine/adenosine deaminase-related metal-dependent hydrolase